MRDPDQTKNRLIEVASKMMADHGVAGLRVDRVASLAKINKRMIYHYFGDKEGLAAKVLEHQLLAITPVLSESEMSVIQYFFDQPGTVAYLSAPGKGGCYTRVVTGQAANCSDTDTRFVGSMAFVSRLGGSTDSGPVCTLEFSGHRSPNNPLTTAGECCSHLAGTAQGADFPASHGEPHTFAVLVST